MATNLMPDWMQSLLLLLFIGLAIALAIQQARELKKMQLPVKKKVYTIIKCGDKEETREFHEGDYVGKKVECNDETGLITKIYAVYPENQSGSGR